MNHTSNFKYLVHDEVAVRLATVRGTVLSPSSGWGSWKIVLSLRVWQQFWTALTLMIHDGSVSETSVTINESARHRRLESSSASFEEPKLSGAYCGNSRSLGGFMVSAECGCTYKHWLSSDSLWGSTNPVLCSSMTLQKGLGGFMVSVECGCTNKHWLSNDSLWGSTNPVLCSSMTQQKWRRMSRPSLTLLHNISCSFSGTLAFLRLTRQNSITSLYTCKKMKPIKEVLHAVKFYKNSRCMDLPLKQYSSYSNLT